MAKVQMRKPNEHVHTVLDRILYKLSALFIFLLCYNKINRKNCMYKLHSERLLFYNWNLNKFKDCPLKFNYISNVDIITVQSNLCKFFSDTKFDKVNNRS